MLNLGVIMQSTKVFTLLEFINTYYSGIKSRFATDYGYNRQNVNKMISDRFIVIDNELFRPVSVKPNTTLMWKEKRDTKKLNNVTINNATIN